MTPRRLLAVVGVVGAFAASLLLALLAADVVRAERGLERGDARYGAVSASDRHVGGRHGAALRREPRPARDRRRPRLPRRAPTLPSRTAARAGAAVLSACAPRRRRPAARTGRARRGRRVSSGRALQPAWSSRARGGAARYRLGASHPPRGDAFPACCRARPLEPRRAVQPRARASVAPARGDDVGRQRWSVPSTPASGAGAGTSGSGY